MENILPIIGFESTHLINSEGLVMNYRLKTLKKYVSQSGYKCVTLQSKNFKKIFYMHRLLAMHFIDNPHGYDIVNHRDGNKLNNSLSNLEWCTQLQNVRHAIKNGFMHQSFPKSYKINQIEAWIKSGLITKNEIRNMLDSIK